MRIFIFILSLIFSVAFVLLNVLGFNGVLTLNEFFLVNVIAEVLVCLVLGHFMFRTYANHKKLKKLQQEMTTRQASSVAQEQTAKKKHSLKLKKKVGTASTEPEASQQPAAPRAPEQPSQQPTAPRAPQQPAQQPTAPRAPQQPAQQPTAPRAPQQPAQQPTAPRAPQQPPQQPAAPRASQQLAQQDPRRAPMRDQAPTMPTPQQASTSDATHPMQPTRTEAPDMNSTALYKTPFGK